eukprot:1157830-Pelagomonas_calceolata.AAC.8
MGRLRHWLRRPQPVLTCTYWLQALLKQKRTARQPAYICGLRHCLHTHARTHTHTSTHIHTQASGTAYTHTGCSTAGLHGLIHCLYKQTAYQPAYMGGLRPAVVADAHL